MSLTLSRFSRMKTLVFIAMLLIISTGCAMSEKTRLQSMSEEPGLDSVKKWMSEGANVNEQDAFGCTALMYAALKSRKDVVQLLIERNADVNLKDSTGQTAFMYAAWAGDLDIVKLLIEKGADVNVISKTGTALSYAARKGRTEITRLLVEKGADVNARMEDDKTALTEALADINMSGPAQVPIENTREVVKYLVSKGARLDYPILAADLFDVSIKTEDGELPSLPGYDKKYKLKIKKLHSGRNKLYVKYNKIRRSGQYVMVPVLFVIPTIRPEKKTTSETDWFEFEMDVRPGDIYYLSYKDENDTIYFKIDKLL